MQILKYLTGVFFILMGLSVLLTVYMVAQGGGWLGLLYGASASLSCLATGVILWALDSILEKISALEIRGAPKKAKKNNAEKVTSNNGSNSGYNEEKRELTDLEKDEIGLAQDWLNNNKRD